MLGNPPCASQDPCVWFDSELPVIARCFQGVVQAAHHPEGRFLPLTSGNTLWDRVKILPTAEAALPTDPVTSLQKETRRAGGDLRLAKLSQQFHVSLVRSVADCSQLIQDGGGAGAG